MSINRLQADRGHIVVLENVEGRVLAAASDRRALARQFPKAHGMCCKEYRRRYDTHSYHFL